MKEIDYKKVQLEFIRALKGKRTSARVSGRMERKLNVVARWISGASSPVFKIFLSLCEPAPLSPTKRFYKKL